MSAKMFNPKEHYRKRRLSDYAKDDRQTFAVIAAVAILASGFVITGMFEVHNYELLLSLGGVR